MSDLTIIGSYTSPFVRIVRALCSELGLDYEQQDTGPFGKQTPEQKSLISNNNPLLKVPVLIDKGQPIIDSRVIASYLLQNYPIVQTNDFDASSSIEKENLITVIYGIIDAGVLRFIMRGQGIDMDLPYLARSLERMRCGLKYLDENTNLGAHFGLPELALICGLDWFKKRDIIDWSMYDNLVQIHARYTDRPSLAATRIPDNV